MSSETITRNDLKAILEKCGMSGIAFQEAGILRVTGKAITNTSNAEIQPDTCNVYGDSNIFSTDGTYLTVHKDCMCVSLVTLGVSVTSNAAKMKVLNICRRSAPTSGLGVNAAAALGAWDVTTSTDIISIKAGDILSFVGRTEDGNSTLYNCRVVLIPVISQIDALDTLNTFYPVGTIYQTLNSTFDPNVTWGGTWIKIEAGRFLQATETAANVGDTVAAGLPNITGYTFQRSTNYNTSNITWTGGGALTVSNDTTGTADGLSQINGAVARKRIDFDASNSNSIYGNSTTVQPPALEVFMWQRTA